MAGRPSPPQPGQVSFPAMELSLRQDRAIDLQPAEMNMETWRRNLIKATARQAPRPTTETPRLNPAEITVLLLAMQAAYPAETTVLLFAMQVAYPGRLAKIRRFAMRRKANLTRRANRSTKANLKGKPGPIRKPSRSRKPNRTRKLNRIQKLNRTRLEC